MKFTVDRKALVKMLQCVGTKTPAQKRRDKQVRLFACGALVFVEANQTTAGVEALVLTEGTCFVQQDVFLKVLKTYATKPNITIEADGHTLKFLSTTLPITDFSRAVTPPGKFQDFPVTDLTVLRPQTATLPPALAPTQPPPPEPEPQPVVSHDPGTLPIAEVEAHLVQELARLTNKDSIDAPRARRRLPSMLTSQARALRSMLSLFVSLTHVRALATEPSNFRWI